jgi:aminoglycoside 9-adenylyltransferase
MPLTPASRADRLPPELPVEVPRVLDVLHRTLADGVVAAYLYGSACAGSLHPQSDLDLLVVVARPVTGAARKNLVAELLKISGRDAVLGPARPLDVTVVARDEVVPWRFPPRCDLVFGEWLRDAFLAGQIAPAAPRPDLAILLTTLLQHHRVLVGAPAAAVFDPVPAADLRRAVRACLPSLLNDLRGDERNVMLTLARMWVTLATGDILPKDAAAQWVLGRLPAELAAVLALARSAYLGETRDADWSTRSTQVDLFVHHAVAVIKALP